jgi:hypothetical protein
VRKVVELAKTTTSKTKAALTRKNMKTVEVSHKTHTHTHPHTHTHAHAHARLQDLTEDGEWLEYPELTNRTYHNAQVHVHEKR